MDVRALGQGDFNQCLVFLLAQHNADGSGFGVGFDVAIKVVDVHLHLAQILVRELANLEVDQHLATQQAVVKHQIHKEMVVGKGETLLARLKQKALAQLQQEVFDLIDDGGFKVRLRKPGLL